MLVVQIDPALLAVPSYPDTESAALSFIETLMEWSQLLTHTTGLRLALCSCTVDALVSANSYPATGQMREMLELFDLTEQFSPNDLLRVINSMLERCVSLGDAAGVDVVNYERVDCDPDYLSSVFPRELRRATGSALAGCAAFSRYPQPSRWLAHVTALNVTTAEAVNVRANGVEIDGAGRPDYVVGPFSVVERVLLNKTPQHVFEAADAEDIWRGAEDAAAIHVAIALRAMRIARSGGQAIAYRELPRFYVGQDFLDSLKVRQAHGQGPLAGLVLETCARLVLNNPRHAVGDLLNRKKKPIVRTADGARARRTHVTKRGEGLRLLFWATEGGWEFANVGPKHELAIRSAAPGARIGH